MADTEPKAKKDGSALSLIIPLVVLTLLAGGGGVLIGRQIVVTTKAAANADGKNPAAPPPSIVAVRELPPIVTNLAAPEGAWMRLQTAIVYDKIDAPQMDLVAAKIGEDTLAFVKTLTMAQLQGATGLQHLREDLNERAAVRSDGHVKEMMIEMMVIQ